MKEFKENKIYFTKCKKDWNYFNMIKKGEIIPCIKKINHLNTTFGPLFWHTNHLNNDFCFSWGDVDFYNHFEEPFELKPGMKVRLKDIKDCVDSGISIVKEMEQNFSAVVTVKTCVLGGFRITCDSLPYVYKTEWIEEIEEIPEEDNFCKKININWDMAIKNLSESLKKDFTFKTFKETATSNITTNTKKEEPTWQFRNDKMNYDLICMDLLEENIPLAFVSDGNRHYIFGVWNPVFEWNLIFDEYVIKSFIDGGIFDALAYEVHEVENPEECKKLVEKFTKKFKDHHKNKRNKIMKRSKTLNKTKTFKVFTY